MRDETGPRAMQDIEAERLDDPHWRDFCGLPPSPKIADEEEL